MSDLAYDIEQMYIEGYSPKTIATLLGCPLETVYAWLHENSLDSQAPEACYVMDCDPYSTINS